jgi:hypothetical protein
MTVLALSCGSGSSRLPNPDPDVLEPAADTALPFEDLSLPPDPGVPPDPAAALDPGFQEAVEEPVDVAMPDPGTDAPDMTPQAEPVPEPDPDIPEPDVPALPDDGPPGPDDAGTPDSAVAPEVCEPACDGRECGPDGCGGTCGTCGADEVCDETPGLCKPQGCQPACAGRVCGPDACGGTCPPGCGAGQTCSLEGDCGHTCIHSYGGVFAHAGCSPSYQCCDGTWKKGHGLCGDCACTESTGKVGCMPADTPPVPAGGKFSFVIYGDTQFATANCTSGIPERLAVPKAIAALKPTFVLHTGDLMDHGYENGAYDQFQSCSDPMVSSAPFFPTSGNHDMGSGGILKYRKYLEYQLFTRNPAEYGASYAKDFVVAYGDDPATYSTDFDKPGDKSVVPSGVSFETFFAWRFQNAYFLSFEQGTRWWTNTPKPWVEKHLKAARSDPTIDHVFVLMHHPLYSTTMPDTDDSECILPVRKAYEALFRKHDVTMVFAGHAHLYEHFWVPDDDHETRADPHPATYAGDGSAIHYVITGGGGGPLNSCPTPKKETSWAFFQGRFCDYHVTRVAVDGKKLSVTAVTVSGKSTSYTTKTADTFEIGGQ